MHLLNPQQAFNFWGLVPNALKLHKQVGYSFGIASEWDTGKSTPNRSVQNICYGFVSNIVLSPTIGNTQQANPLKDCRNQLASLEAQTRTEMEEQLT